jgi:hypothetical protein
MKPTSTYKMSKTLKMRLSSTMYGKDLLPYWKRAMIDAELTQDVSKKASLQKRGKNTDVDVD